MTIAVMGARIDLPDAFPLEMPENSGNIVHGNAPIEMFPDSVHYQTNAWRGSGYSDFAEFANKACSHLVITMANTLKLGDPNPTRYANFHRTLMKYKIPIVIFGLGAQSQEDVVSRDSLPPEAIEMLRFLSQRCVSIGVRGEFTARIIRELSGVDNTFVTGCPSLFSRPRQLRKLQSTWHLRQGSPAFAATKAHLEPERELLVKAIQADHYLIEPVNKHQHHAHLAAGPGPFSDADVPYFIKPALKAKRLTMEKVRKYYQSRYRLFRDIRRWYEFVDTDVSFSYGTRFHVNMATLLAGKPALWLTHDSRTRELTNFLNLPSITVQEATTMTADDLSARADYALFFKGIGSLFDNFNNYLSQHGLPKVPAL